MSLTKTIRDYVPEETRDIEIITSEIQFYKNQTETALWEIGKRLNEAKEQLNHGEWTGWLRDRVEFSEVTAQRLMRIAREFSNPSALTDLGTTKVFTLLTLPQSERDDFIAETHTVNGEEKNVAEMSTRELEKAVRERTEAIAAKEEAEAAEAEAKRIAEEYERKFKKAEDAALTLVHDTENLSDEINKLKLQLEELQNADPADNDEDDQIRFEEVRKEAAAAAKKEAEEKLRKKISKADDDRQKAESSLSDAQNELERIKREREHEQAAAAEKIVMLEKRLASASSETVTVFKTHFENAQGCINSMLSCIQKLEDEETRGKLSAALCALCEKTLQGFEKSEAE